MRLTNNMVIRNFTRNVGITAGNVNKYQTQIQTGKSFQYASDAPISAAKSIRYKSKIAQLEQNQKNIEDANELMKVTESALNSYDSILQRISELAVDAANGTRGDEEREAIATEINQLRSEIVSIANTKYNGRYIFSGFETEKTLLNDDGTYNMDVTTSGISKEAINYSIGFGSSIQVNTLGPDVFGGKGEMGEKAGVRANIDNLLNAMKNGESSEIRKAGTAIEDDLQICLDSLADIGAKMNRLELTKNRVENSLANITESLSLNEDADYAEAATNLANSKTIYEAALAAGAKTLSISLMDYI